MATIRRRGFLATALALLGGAVWPRKAVPDVPPGAPKDSPVRYDPALKGYRRPNDPRPNPHEYDTIDPVMTWRVDYQDAWRTRAVSYERVSWQSAFDDLKVKCLEMEPRLGYRHLIFEPESGLRITIDEYRTVLHSHGVRIT